MTRRFSVTEDAQGGLLTALGAMGIRLVVSRQYLRFIRPKMEIPLLAASLMLLALGIATLIRAWGRPLTASDADEQNCHQGHGHTAGPSPAVGWLLALPLAVLLLVAPTSLGSFAANRQAVKTTRLEQAQNVTFDPLPDQVNGRVSLTLTDFSKRGLYDSKESLKGIPIRLIGFVNRDASAPGGFFITRFKIACCAADAYPIQVVLLGAAGTWPDDTWLTVDGTWKATTVDPASDELLRAALTVQKVTKLTITPDPYE